MKYSIEQLSKELEAGKTLKYLFFWGHTSLSKEVSKACLSQWFPSPFKVNGMEYKTAEHWMMAYKAELFGDLEIRDTILKSQKPGEVKELGRKIRNFDQLVWDENKYQIVVNGNFHKFRLNQDLGNFLKNTKKRILVEASPVDSIWGIGLSHEDPNAENPRLWKGSNLLGFALMETRDLLVQLESESLEK